MNIKEYDYVVGQIGAIIYRTIYKHFGQQLIPETFNNDIKTEVDSLLTLQPTFYPKVYSEFFCGLYKSEDGSTVTFQSHLRTLDEYYAVGFEDIPVLNLSYINVARKNKNGVWIVSFDPIETEKESQ